MAVYKLKDRPGYRVVVQVGGRVGRRSSAKWTRAEAHQVDRDLRAELERRESFGDDRPARPMFADALAEYLPEVDAQKSPDRTRSHLNAIADYIEGQPIDQAAVVAREYRKDARAAGLSAGTIARRVALIKRLAAIAFEQEWIDAPVHQRIKNPAPNNGRHVYLHADQVHSLAAAMPRAGGYVLLSAYTGLRRSQLLRVHPGMLHGGWLLLGTDSKSGRPHRIPVHPVIADLVPRLPLPGVTPTILRNEFERARAALGMSGVRFHDLRHTFAAWVLSRPGATLMHVRDLLDHSSIQTTQRYAHIEGDSLAGLVGGIGAVAQPDDADSGAAAGGG